MKVEESETCRACFAIFHCAQKDTKKMKTKSLEGEKVNSILICYYIKSSMTEFLEQQTQLFLLNKT